MRELKFISLFALALSLRERGLLQIYLTARLISIHVEWLR